MSPLKETISVYRVVNGNTVKVDPGGLYGAITYVFEDGSRNIAIGKFWASSVPVRAFKKLLKKNPIGYKKVGSDEIITSEEYQHRLQEPLSYAVYDDDEDEWEWPKAFAEWETKYKVIQESYTRAFGEDIVEETDYDIKVEDLYVASPSKFASSEYILSGAVNCIFELYSENIAADEMYEVAAEYKDKITSHDFKGEFSKINGKFINLKYPKVIRVPYHQVVERESEIRKEVRARVISAITPVVDASKETLQGLFDETNTAIDKLSSIAVVSKPNRGRVDSAMRSLDQIKKIVQKALETK